MSASWGRGGGPVSRNSSAMRGASRSHHRDNGSAQSQSDESDANGNFHAVPREDSRVSRTLTMILRHKAEQFGLTMRPDGYVDLQAILAQPIIKRFRPTPDLAFIQHIVRTNDKQRFALVEEDGVWFIRANQGHSGAHKDILEDDLMLKPVVDHRQHVACVHGTTKEAWALIEKTGLNRMARKHIHFSSHPPGSKDVISGMRSSSQVFIHVDLEKALADGVKFFVSGNGVILTEGVNNSGVLPPQYFSLVEFADQKSRNKRRLDSESKVAAAVAAAAAAAPQQVDRTWADRAGAGSGSFVHGAAGSASKGRSSTEAADDIKQSSNSAPASQCPFRYLLVLDFEATCDSNRSFGPQEIIEWPVVVIDTQLQKEVACFHKYVRPVHQPQLTAFCTELTGIEQATVAAAEPFPVVYAQLREFLQQQGIIDQSGHAVANDPNKTFAIVTCGDWDLKTMLPAQLRLSQLPALPCFLQWINIKKLFEEHYGGRADGMTGMLQRLRIKLEGRHHSGIDDSRNIAAIAIEMLRQQKAFSLTWLSASNGVGHQVSLAKRQPKPARVRGS